MGDTDTRFYLDAEIGTEVLEPGKLSRKIKARGGKIMMVEVSFEAGAQGAPHEHPHDQATYCLSGEFDFATGGKTRRLRAGDTVFIPGGERHGTTCVKAGKLLDCFTPQREDFLKK